MLVLHIHHDIIVVIITAVRQNELQVIEVKAGSKAFVAEHVGDELILLVLEHANLLLHGIAGEAQQGVVLHGLLLNELPIILTQLLAAAAGVMSTCSR